jgi:hypothetical protein
MSSLMQWIVRTVAPVSAKPGSLTDPLQSERRLRKEASEGRPDFGPGISCVAGPAVNRAPKTSNRPIWSLCCSNSHAAEVPHADEPAEGLVELVYRSCRRKTVATEGAMRVLDPDHVVVRDTSLAARGIKAQLGLHARETNLRTCRDSSVLCHAASWKSMTRGLLYHCVSWAQFNSEVNLPTRC